jgi:hypothetical protein
MDETGDERKRGGIIREPSDVLMSHHTGALLSAPTFHTAPGDEKRGHCGVNHRDFWIEMHLAQLTVNDMDKI